MRKLATVALALAAVATLAGCASASAEAVVDTKTPAPAALSEAELSQVVDECRAAVLSDVLYGWPGGEAGAAEEFDSSHDLADAVVTASGDGVTVQFPGQPGYVAPAIDMVCEWTPDGATARVDG
ncbi:hypothetical protein [Gulosibacter sediminis]|uniref:hypothetical protein n=1 Tax=Gulosibacter sediminis TaxID=1729695 RepID=UPI0024A9C834|nr:hypothetical protein [Gulosibacter sediminis]